MNNQERPKKRFFKALYNLIVCYAEHKVGLPKGTWSNFEEKS